MDIKDKVQTLITICALLVIALVVSGAHDYLEAPEIKEVQSICPVLTITEQAECDICEVCTSYDEEFKADYEQDFVVKNLTSEEMSDDNFKEDLVDFMNTEYSLNIEDVDDLEFSVEDMDIEWSDREDGEALVTVELKTEYIVDGDDDDDHTKRVVAKFYLEDEDLEEFDDYAFEDY